MTTAHPYCNPMEKPHPNEGGNSSRYTNGIMVLGMHRSGTSAVAGLLGLAGAYLGDPAELLPANAEDNPKGYWERHDVVAAHDAALDAIDCKWDHIGTLDLRRITPTDADALRERLRQIGSDLSRPGKPWLVKDPRLCLLLPYWLPLIEEPAFVVVVRDPREIAASMCDGPRGAYTSNYIVSLWEKYMRCALTTLRGRRAIFIDYATLLSAPESQCQRLIQALSVLGVRGLGSPTRDKISEFLDPHLRRSQAKQYVQLLPTQVSLFNWLQAKCETADPQVVTGVPEAGMNDEVLREFERALAVQTERVRATTLSEVNAASAALAEQRNLAVSELAQAQSTINENLKSLRSLQARLEEAHRQQSSMAMRLAEVTHQRNVAAGEADQIRHERNIAASRRIEIERHAHALEDSVRDLHSSWSWRLTQPLRTAANFLSLRMPWDLEQRIYRAYYALPGISTARKRAFILWLHGKAGWLTHNTLSYRLLRQTPVPVAVQPDDRTTARMDQQRADAIIRALARKPTISIAMPVYNVDRRWLLAAAESVRRQFYPYWQLCIADDASTRRETREALDEIEAWHDKRIRLVRLKHNVGIAEASNAALKLAAGEYVGFLDNDDELTRDALLEVASRVNVENPDLIYSDEDKLDESSAHVEVHCKPDYSPDYFFSINYLCHFAVIRRELLIRIGGFRADFDGAQDYDLLLRATEHTEKISHIAKVLYHWRRIPGSTASTPTAKPQTSDAGRRAVAESMRRRQIDCTVEAGPYPNTYRVRRKIAGDPLVSILVPFRDKPDLLKACVTSILGKTRYSHYEILCIDNGSIEPETHTLLETLEARDARVRVLRHETPFNFSEINNFAASQAQGEHLLFLNNDTEVISEEWLDAMLEHSQRPDVGVVGARLWYADGTIQHAGVILGPGGVAGHGHLMQPGDDPGYFARIRLMQNLSAVTFACAMTQRRIFEQIGGLNEHDLRIAFNDVDYCLRVREAGYLIVYTPFALLHHYESKSRGYEDTPEKQLRFAGEIRYMQQRHKAALERGDPYYNPGLLLNNSFQPDPGYASAIPR